MVFINIFTVLALGSARQLSRELESVSHSHGPGKRKGMNACFVTPMYSSRLALPLELQ